MELPPDSAIEERLVKTFPNTRLRELARATGLVQRDGGKLEADALFWSLTLGFVTGHYRTLEEFRQEYIDTFGGIARCMVSKLAQAYHNSVTISRNSHFH